MDQTAWITVGFVVTAISILLFAFWWSHQDTPPDDTIDPWV